jgi:hypothetical protein
MTGTDNGRRRANFSSDHNLTSKAVFRLHIAEVSSHRIVVDIENVSTLCYLLLPTFHPETLVTSNESSAINRAIAV